MEVDGINSSFSKTDSIIIKFHRFFKRIKSILKENQIIVGCFIAIIVILILTYFYSFKYRNKQKTK